jgi:hypothetical protein
VTPAVRLFNRERRDLSRRELATVSDAQPSAALRGFCRAESTKVADATGRSALGVARAVSEDTGATGESFSPILTNYVSVTALSRDHEYDACNSNSAVPAMTGASVTRWLAGMIPERRLKHRLEQKDPKSHLCPEAVWLTARMRRAATVKGS